MTTTVSTACWNLHACTPGAAQQQLLTAVLADDAAALQAWRDWRGSQDLAVIDSSSFRLLPLVYQRIHQLDPEDPLLPRLQRVYRHTWFKSQIQLNQLRSLLDALEDAAIDCMVLKGAAMSLRYYRDPGLRFMHDVDVLVPHGQFERALGCLQAVGWRVQASLPGRLRLLHRSRFLHAISLERGGAEVDLHTQMSRFVWQDDVTLWGSARKEQWQGRTVRLPSTTDMLHQCCLHGVSWSHAILSWIPDALRLLSDPDDPVDWGRLLALAQQSRTVCQLQHALVYLAEEWSAPVPPTMLAALRNAPTSRVERAEYAQLAQLPSRSPAVLARRLWLRACRFRQAGRAALSPIRPAALAWLGYFALYILALGIWKT